MDPLNQNIYECCELCPRRCRVDRRMQKGYCRAGTEIRAAKAMLHEWEEPAVGLPAGTVFFSGCTLGCVYCQNYRLSHEDFGIKLTPQKLAEVFLDLQKKGAVNIDLVTPTHYLPGVIKAIDLCKPKLYIPVVYNCGGYERREVIEALEGYVDIWLPDIKYFDDALAVKYSSAPGYFETALSAVEEMLRQVKSANAVHTSGAWNTEGAGAEKETGEKKEAGKKKSTGEAGSIAGQEEKKLILRHMVLPGQKNDSVKLLRAVADRLGTEGYLISLMSQYTPFGMASAYPEINRRVTTYEYEKVLEEALSLGFEGFMQERTSAKEEYTPEFDLGGLGGRDVPSR